MTTSRWARRAGSVIFATPWAGRTSSSTAQSSSRQRPPPGRSSWPRSRPTLRFRRRRAATRRRSDREPRSTRQRVLRGHTHQDQRVGASGARRQELHRSAVGEADRRQGEGDREALRRDLLERDRGAHRAGRARSTPSTGRPCGFPTSRSDRVHRADRQLHQEVQGAGDDERLPPALPRPDEVQGKTWGSSTTATSGTSTTARTSSPTRS